MHERDFERKRDLYLLVLSILLGISVMKLTEVITFGEQLKIILKEAAANGLTANVIGVYLFVSSYLLFFILMLFALVAVVAHDEKGHTEGNGKNVDTLVAMCLGALALAYGSAFAFAIYRLSIP